MAGSPRLSCEDTVSILIGLWCLCDIADSLQYLYGWSVNLVLALFTGLLCLIQMQSAYLPRPTAGIVDFILRVILSLLITDCLGGRFPLLRLDCFPDLTCKRKFFLYFLGLVGKGTSLFLVPLRTLAIGIS